MMKHILRNTRYLTGILVISIAIVSLCLNHSNTKTHVKVEPIQIANVPLKNSIKEISIPIKVTKEKTVNISKVIRTVGNTGNEGTDKQVHITIIN